MTSVLCKICVTLLCCMLGQMCMASQQCQSSKTTSIKFSTDSHRNQTGHWISKIQVQLNPENNKNSGRWSVDIQQSTMECNGDTALVVEAYIASPPPRVGTDYELFPGVGYYKFHKDAQTWKEGKAICEHEGGHLAIINSKQESAVLKLLFSRNKDIKNANHSGVVGVGFHDQYVEGEYITIFGLPLTSTGFVSWSPSPPQPDDNGASTTHPGEDCGSIHPDGLLNDINCDYKIAFICEQEL